MNRIFTARDYALKRDGVKTVRERIRKWQEKHRKNGIIVNIKDLDKPGTGTPVMAQIWQGTWIAKCECGGAEFVDPKEPIFFCWSCGNRSNDNKCRPVDFPDKHEKIEEKILERPVNDIRGLDELQQAEAAMPLIFVEGQGLSRSWVPGETLKDLKDQQDKAIKEWEKDGKHGI